MQGRVTIDSLEDPVFTASAAAPARGRDIEGAGPADVSFLNRFSGATRVALGFLAGALFALAPVYYYSMGRDAGLRTSPATQGGDPVPAASADYGGKPNRFASRMTYELTHLPEEPPRVARVAPSPAALPASAQVAAAPVAAPPTIAPVSTPAPAPAVALPVPIPLPAVVAPQPPAAAAKAPAVPAITAQPEPVALPGPRVANARPIRVEPLDSRDTTRAIAKEARKPEVAEAPREPQQKAATAAQRTQLAVAPSSTAALPIAQAPAADGEGDIVAGRFAATREWLGTAPETTHTIQLMGMNSEAQLRNHLKALAKTLEPGKIFVFRTMAQGKPAISVVYGAFPDKKVALQALEKLPPTLTANRPVLRTVNGIRAEMKQHGTSY